MIPKDLTGFSVEQLRGFSTAVDREITALRVEAKGDPEKLSALEGLLDSRDDLNAAIDAAVDAEAAELAVAAATTDDNDPATDVNDDDNVIPIVDPNATAEAVVEEAVASATMGGGDVPRVTRDEADKSRGDVRKFLRALSTGGVRHEERHSWTTMRRETNHVVKANADATEAIAAAIEDRKAGSDKTAAGCFCGPDDAISAIKECGDTVRPFSDTLPTITASGDVRYVRQIPFADALAGVTQWTCADQSAVDPEDIATWKPCFELECEAEVTSALYAVSACASFNTQQLIGNEALIANLEHVMQVAFSKTAELLVYNQVRALSSQYSFGYDLTGYGASAQLLAAVGWAMELIKASLRESDPNYTLALPAGLVERVLTDGVIRGFDEYRVRADLYDRLNTLGVTNIVELVDEITCPVGSPLAHATPTAPTAACDRVAAPAHPVEQEILLYRPEDFLLGVGPDIDLGVTRSPELARQNKLQWFTEGFEFVEKVGCAPAIDLVVPFCASGIRPALGTGEDCTEIG